MIADVQLAGGLNSTEIVTSHESSKDGERCLLPASAAAVKVRRRDLGHHHVMESKGRRTDTLHGRGDAGSKQRSAILTTFV